jgi:hypothetical protein
VTLRIPIGEVSDILALVPNLGYFGSSSWNSLVVPVNSRIDAIRLQLGIEQPEYLNLQQLAVISNGRDISAELADSGRCLRSSAVVDDMRSASELLRGTGVHTEKEVSPSWGLRLDEPVHIDRLIIKNRADVYGARSNSLQIVVSLGDLHCAIYQPHCLSGIGWFLGLLRTAAVQSGDLPAQRLALLQESRRVALTVEDARVAKIWRFLQLINLKEIEEPLRFANIDLLAAVTCRYHALGYQIETRDLHQFSGLLARKRDILAYERVFNAALRGFSRDVVTVARHFITAAKLLTQRELYCELIQEIHEIAARTGNEVCLGYGTLLGCVRDRGFIAHDDDVDLMVRVPVGARGPEPGQRDLLLAELVASGYVVEQFVGFEHHNLKKSGLCIELFPLYTDGETVRLYMEGMRFRSIPDSVLFPLRRDRLYEVEVNVPAAPDLFLAERYGPGWKTPDRFYEWRWELEAEAGSDDSGAAEADEALRNFSEERYLHLHADVARAVRAGLFKSGRSHFIEYGRKEGRLTG